ncbi:MAG: hypothetical protein P8Y25_14860, partial [Chromatiaceae bacterium]
LTARCCASESELSDSLKASLVVIFVISLYSLRMKNFGCLLRLRPCYFLLARDRQAMSPASGLLRGGAA